MLVGRRERGGGGFPGNGRARSGCRQRPRLRSAGRSAVRDRLEAAAPRSRVGAGRSPSRCVPEAGLGRAARRQERPRKVCHATGRAEKRRLGDALCPTPGPGGRAGRGLRMGRGLAPRERRGEHSSASRLWRKVGASLAAGPQHGDLEGGRTASRVRRRALVQRCAGKVFPSRCGLGRAAPCSEAVLRAPGNTFPGLLLRCCTRPPPEWVCALDLRA